MQNSFSEPAQAGQPAKMPIPRLQRNEPPPPRNDKKDAKQKLDRVGRACINCRKRKIRCSGETSCGNCGANELDCTYEQTRRDRLKSATHRNQTLVNLLKDLSLRVDEEDRHRIQDALDGVDDDLPSSAGAASQKSLGKRRKASTPEDETQVPGEVIAPASVGSNEDLDLLNENLLQSRESRETGFVGSNSEIQWLRTLQREMAAPGEEPSGRPYGPSGASSTAVARRSEAMHERQRSSKFGPTRPVNESTFYLDSDSIELEVMVDPHEIPSADLAERLFNCYITTVHKSFPILPDEFEHQFRRYYDAVRKGRPFQVPDKWSAISNLVFAIGARYSHLIKAEWRGDDRDHLVYMTRAIRLLGWKDVMMVVSAPDLSLIQTTGLLAFYYLVIGHVSRSWVMIGVAIRLGLAVGLHLRNEDLATPEFKKEPMVRTWWSLHSIECLLSSVTGRPCVLEYEDCTVSLPQHLSDEVHLRNAPASAAGRARSRRRSEYRSPTEQFRSSNSLESARRMTTRGSYLDAHLRIGLISQKVLSNLYAPRVASRPWEHIQRTIPALIKELEEWRNQALPEEDDVEVKASPVYDSRETLLLRFYYCSIKILITRPCLCRIERRIRVQSKGSTNFNQRIAETCVRTAEQLTDLLPDQPVPEQLYANGPWWSLLQNLMQAMVVLLLEFSYSGPHIPLNGAGISTYIKKLLRWLRAMMVNDPVADRAYKVVVKILRSSRTNFQASVNDLLVEDVPSYMSPRSPSSAAASGAPSSAWFGRQFRPDPPGTSSVNIDPQLFADLGRSQEESHTSLAYSQIPPPSQAQPDQYSFFLPDHVSTPSVYSNPFVTSFDEDIPALLEDMGDIWAPSSTAEGQLRRHGGGSDPQQGFSFSNFSQSS